MLDWLRKVFSKETSEISETELQKQPQIGKGKRFRYLPDGITRVEVKDD